VEIKHTELEEELQWMHITEDSIWNTVREHETKSSFTQSELKLIAVGQSSESVAQKKILETETGRPSVPTDHQNKNWYPVHPEIQAHE
jgi:hypothetical protein